MTDVWHRIATVAHRYPSPHNSQPMRLRPVDATTAELYYDLARGLPAEPGGASFGFVCAGVLIELVAIVAHDLGLTLQTSLRGEDLRFDGPDRLQHIGTVRLHRSEPTPVDLDPALIALRRTSRVPYAHRRLPAPLIDELAAEAAAAGHRWSDTCEPAHIRAIMRINQRTLFDDVANDAVRAELATWLRYTERDAARTGDGLSARCLRLPGPVLRSVVRHHRWWSRPLPEAVARWLYLRSMRGVCQLAWITGPFDTNPGRVAAGRLLIRLWLRLTAEGAVMHPFGSVITNRRSHRRFVDTVGERAADGTTWMLMRVGYSATPPRSHRLPPARLLLEEEA